MCTGAYPPWVRGRRLGYCSDSGVQIRAICMAAFDVGYSRPAPNPGLNPGPVRRQRVVVTTAAEIGADLAAVVFGQRDRYQATVRCTASRCAVGSRRPKAASNLLASMTKGARNW
jgi:hypothetical protein